MSDSDEKDEEIECFLDNFNKTSVEVIQSDDYNSDFSDLSCDEHTPSDQ